jgi:hypothetical protein
MAASKPISWMYRTKTTLISLSNNFGTLFTLVMGCFPLDIQPFRTMSDYSIYISSPSEHNYLLIGFSHPPMSTKKHYMYKHTVLHKITVLYLPIFYLNYLLT